MACFLSQQSAEKSIKALLQHRGVESRGHSLIKLLQEVGGADNIDDIVECAAFLDRQYVPSRYPDAYLEGAPYEYYTERDGRECLRCARTILSWVRGAIGK